MGISYYDHNDMKIAGLVILHTTQKLVFPSCSSHCYFVYDRDFFGSVVGGKIFISRIIKNQFSQPSDVENGSNKSQSVPNININH